MYQLLQFHPNQMDMEIQSLISI